MNRTMPRADSNKPVTSRNLAHPTRKSGRPVVWIALAGLALSSGAGCDDDNSREFREAALDSLRQGVSTILDGLVDGAFAVIDVDAENATARGR